MVTTEVRELPHPFSVRETSTTDVPMPGNVETGTSHASILNECIVEVSKHDPALSFVLRTYRRLCQEGEVSDTELTAALQVFETKLGVETFLGKRVSKARALDAYMGSMYRGTLLEELTTPETQSTAWRFLHMLARSSFMKRVNAEMPSDNRSVERARNPFTPRWAFLSLVPA